MNPKRAENGVTGHPVARACTTAKVMASLHDIEGKGKLGASSPLLLVAKVRDIGLRVRSWAGEKKSSMKDDMPTF